MIRLANLEDIPRLLPLARDYMDNQADAGAMPLHDRLAELISWSVENGEAVVVAEEDGHLVGFVAWASLPGHPPGWGVGLGTYVKPSYRNLRIATEMTERAKEHCHLRGLRWIDGMVLAGNDGGMARALKTGADVIGVHVRWSL